MCRLSEGDRFGGLLGLVRSPILSLYPSFTYKTPVSETYFALIVPIPMQVYYFVFNHSRNTFEKEM